MDDGVGSFDRFDSASVGNMTNDGANTMTYDAENRVLTTAGASYTYDGKSLRVKKVSGSTTTVYIFSGSKVIAEYDNGAAPGAPSREYVYSGSQLLAKIESSATTYFHADHLSGRVVTDSSGSSVRTFGHYPYGETWYETGPASKWKFTSYERDGESGNDYAMFRTHVNRLGRFSSPDPLAGSISDPQSLNRFAYTLDDPTNLIDPLGLSWHNPAYACADGSAERGDCNFWTDMGSGFSCFDTVETVGVGEGRQSVPATVCEIQTPGLQVGPPQRPRGRLRDKDKKKFLKNAEKVIEALLNNPDCRSFLQSLGISPNDLADAVFNQQAFSSSSTITLGDAGLVASDSGLAGTSVASFFKANSGVQAVAQPGPGATNVYYRSGSGIFSAASVSPGNIGHEALHNLTGKSDANLQQLLGVPVNPNDTSNISKALADHGCTK